MEGVPGSSGMSPLKKSPSGKLVTSSQNTSEDILAAIRKKVYEFWFRREIPNVTKILEAINNDPGLPRYSESSLYRLLKKMDFKYIVGAQNSAILDKEYIVTWRQRYIQNIQKYRHEGRPIYYLDETWINAGDVRRKLSVDASVTSPANAQQRGLSAGIPEPPNKGKRLTIAHVGSSDGFVPGALLYFKAKRNSAVYHDGTNGDTFFDWFRSVLPKLRDGAIIVMDNAPCHSAKVEKYPTMSWRKNNIIIWLLRKGVKVEPQYVKAQLVELSRKFRRHEYLIDEYAKQHGHTVVRLPPYHSELNPIELAWAQLKEYVRARNTTSKLADVRNLVVEAVENVSAEMWQNFIRHTVEEENRLHQLDHITDLILDSSGVEWVDHSDSDDSDSDDDL